MKINSFCLTCLIQMQESQIRHFTDEEKKMRYMREVLAFLSICYQTSVRCRKQVSWKLFLLLWDSLSLH